MDVSERTASIEVGSREEQHSRSQQLFLVACVFTLANFDEYLTNSHIFNSPQSAPDAFIGHAVIHVIFTIGSCRFDNFQITCLL